LDSFVIVAKIGEEGKKSQKINDLFGREEFPWSPPL
jgi:hypothetical protein